MNKMSAKYKILHSLLENPLSVTADGSASIGYFFAFITWEKFVTSPCGPHLETQKFCYVKLGT